MNQHIILYKFMYILINKNVLVQFRTHNRNQWIDTFRFIESKTCKIPLNIDSLWSIQNITQTLAMTIIWRNRHDNNKKKVHKYMTIIKRWYYNPDTYNIVYKYIIPMDFEQNTFYCVARELIYFLLILLCRKVFLAFIRIF